MKSCLNCIYSKLGETSCFRLMDYAYPKLDVSKGVECGENKIHWLGEEDK